MEGSYLCGYVALWLRDTDAREFESKIWYRAGLATTVNLVHNAPMRVSGGCGELPTELGIFENLLSNSLSMSQKYV